MLGAAPAHVPAPPSDRSRKVYPAQGARRGRVALLAGCVKPVLAPSINEAAIRVLNRHGIEVVIAEGEGCCGSLVHHMGREEQALAQARAMIDAWTVEIDGEGLDAILITASGCGTIVKDYGFMLRTDPAYAEKAARVSALAKDVSEYLCTLELAASGASAGLIVAYHSACSLAARAEDRRAHRKNCFPSSASSSKMCRKGICVAARLEPTTSSSPHLADRLRDRKVAQHRTARARRDRGRQYRLHHADRRGHGHSGRPYGRADRLGDRRPGARTAQRSGQRQCQRCRGRLGKRGLVAPSNGARCLARRQRG